MNLFNTNTDFDGLFNLETDENHGETGISARMIRMQTKIRMLNRMKRQKVHELIDRLPQEGEALHIVSNGSFDYFTLVPHILDVENKTCTEFWFSTWTMSQNNVAQIIKLFDEKRILEIHALTGLYFKKREPHVYFNLFKGLHERGQRLFSHENHAKVTLLKIENEHYVIEGSANFTANPRVEQFVVNNSKELFDFHKDWMNHVFKNKNLEDV